jgi:hypothetical protein
LPASCWAAHDLHPGAAADQHGGGVVPVAAGRALVGVALQLLEGQQHLLELLALDGLGIAVAEDLQIEVAAAVMGQGGGEDDAVLPGLAAMG